MLGAEDPPANWCMPLAAAVIPREIGTYMFLMSKACTVTVSWLPETLMLAVAFTSKPLIVCECVYPSRTKRLRRLPTRVFPDAFHVRGVVRVSPERSRHEADAHRVKTGSTGVRPAS